jgi:16S rRNA (guanine527-N7)-methyltransferase
MREMTTHTIKGPGDFAAAFGVSAETLARLSAYEALLKQWQKAVNLVAPSTLDDIWHRHFADSAQLVPLAPSGVRTWTDLGAGGGFPGLVCAIVLADAAFLDRRTAGLHVTLIESDTRKAAFLREVLRAVSPLPGIEVEILPARAESVKTQVNFVLPRVVSARALAPLEKLLALAFPLSPPGTTGLFCKGKEVDHEIDAARQTWNFDVALVPSVTDRSGRIAVITNLERKAKD